MTSPPSRGTHSSRRASSAHGSRHTPDAADSSPTVEDLRARLHSSGAPVLDPQWGVQPFSVLADGASAANRVVDVAPTLASLLPHGGLMRGSTVVVEGDGAATSLALALCAEASRQGSWIATVGMEHLSWAAAREAGVNMERVIAVSLGSTPTKGVDGLAADAVAAVMEAAEVIVVDAGLSIGVTAARRLIARARERGVVLIRPFGAHAPSFRRDRWPIGPDVHFRVMNVAWSGIGQGWGHGSARRVDVEVTGRRAAGRPRRASLWLPTAASPADTTAAEGVTTVVSATPTVFESPDRVSRAG